MKIIRIVQKPFNLFSNTVNCSFFFLIFLKLLKWKVTISIFSKIPNQKLLHFIKTKKMQFSHLSNDKHCIINCCKAYPSELIPFWKISVKQSIWKFIQKNVMACPLDKPCSQPKDFPQWHFRLREMFYDQSDDLFIDVTVISQMDFRVSELAGFIIT